MRKQIIALLGLAMVATAGQASAEGIHFRWGKAPVQEAAATREHAKAPAHVQRRLVRAQPGTPVAAAPEPVRGSGFLGIFGARPPVAPQPQFSDDTLEKDAVLAERSASKPYTIKPEFQPQSVRFTGYQAGTIVIDTHTRFLYLVESPFSARRYPIAVGREGMLFTGEATIGDMQEWPKWFPTKDMIKNEAKKYARYKDGMDGGMGNPLGARAIYLYQGKRDTYIRIHGTNEPRSIGSAASHGCFRMYNAQVMDLYNRVKLGSKVVVL